jgi:hypothetical protein
MQKSRPDLYKLIAAEAGTTTPEKAYNYLNPTARAEHLTCKVCNKPTAEFITVKLGYRVYCSNKCSANDPSNKAKITAGFRTEAAKEKRKETLIERYGTDSIISLHRDKAEATMLERYGSTTVGNVQEFKDKRKTVLLERYGVINPFLIPKIAEKSRKARYDAWAKISVKNAENKRLANELLSQRLLEDFKGTMLELYEMYQSSLKLYLQTRAPEAIEVMKLLSGDSWGEKLYMLFNDMTVKPMCRVCKTTRVSFIQTSYGFSKTCSRGCSAQDGEKYQLAFETGIRYKDHTLPSGKTVKLMGYEPQVIAHLLEQGILEEELAFEDDVPYVLYEHAGKTKLYMPDFFLTSKNAVCEVKSSYTYKAELTKNLAKLQAARAAGYEMYLFIWDDNTQSLISETEALMRETNTIDKTHDPL